MASSIFSSFTNAVSSVAKSTSFGNAAKSAAKGAADSLFAPKGSASPQVITVQVPSSSSSGVYTPTPSSIPSWALPAAAVAAAVFFLTRR
jgi:hypothetical protein